MAPIIQLEADVFVAPQLVEADFAELAARGIGAVVNNRPDGEAPDQLPHRQARAAALRHDLAYRHFPVIGANITDHDVVDAFARLIEDLPRPILFYCGSGKRSAVLWTQVAAARRGVAAALQEARAAGFDLEVLRDELIEQASERARPSRDLIGAAA